jgi:hypothetical protein
MRASDAATIASVLVPALRAGGMHIVVDSDPTGVIGAPAGTRAYLRDGTRAWDNIDCGTGWDEVGDVGAAVDVSALVPQLGCAQYPGLFGTKVAWARGPTLPAGGTYTLLDESGAGFVSRVSMTFNSSTQATRENSRLRVYVDGEVNPSIDVAFRDLCCCRGAGGAFNSANLLTEHFGAQATAYGIGTSFWFALPIPYSSHIRILVVNGDPSGTALLGGWAQYHVGSGLNWGKYGKLRSYNLSDAVSVDAGISCPAYSDVDLFSVAAAHGGLLAGVYLHFVGGDGNYHYQEGFFDFFADGASVFTQRYDSVEDFFAQGFYFAAGVQVSRELGCTYRDGAATVGAYRFFDRDPITFSSSLRLSYHMGWPSPNPSTNPVVVRGVVWYYEATAAVTSIPTLKGDQGVAGPTGPAGSGVFATVADVDFSQLTGQTILTNGGFTLSSGLAGTAFNWGNSQAFALQAGSGLYVRNSAANTANADGTLSGPGVYFKFVDIAAALAMSNWSEAWLWFVFEHAVQPSAAYEYAQIGLISGPPATYAAANLNRCSLIEGYGGSGHFAGQMQSTFGGGTSAYRGGYVGATLYDVFAFRIQAATVEGYYGLSSGGNLPARSSLVFAGRAGICGAGVPAFDGWAVWAAVSTGNTAGNADLRLKRMKVETR